jgi:hypothetical protein
MKNRLLFASIFLLLHYLSFSQSITIQPLPPQADAFYDKAMPQARTDIKSWVIKTAVQWKTKPADEPMLRNTAKNQFPDMKVVDLDALVVLVMTKCANDEERDLKEQIDELRKITDQQASQRQRSSISGMQERRSKFIVAITNNMKKVLPVQESIIQSFKQG